MFEASVDEARVAAALRAVLPGSVALEVAGESPDHGHEVVVVVGGRRLRVLWKGRVWLSVAGEILSQPDRPDLVVADRVSPASREALSAAGVGWVETSGAAEISTDFLIVSRDGQQRPLRGPRDSWTPAVLGVAEALLVGTKPTVSATHETTGLSVGACTKALDFLEGCGLLEAGAGRGPKSGRRVVDQDALLGSYVAAAHELESFRPVSFGVAWRDPVDGLAELGSRWDKAGIPWVATGMVAAAVAAPHVTSVGVANVYTVATTPAEIDAVAAAVGLRRIEGGRLTLSPLPTRATLALAQVMDGLRVAPWPRLVADLRRIGVRGEEAAEQVRELFTDG
jgi:hypothetical protein